MFLPSWFGFIRPSTRRTPSGRKPGRQRTAHQRGLRLNLEQLEERTLLSSYTAATVSDLIADINASNQAGGLNTIALVAGKTFSLTAVNNTGTGLPVIAANDNLSIVGNGDTIERSAATGTPAFRLFHLAFSAALTLQNLTLQGGLAFGSGFMADGGAIFNEGSLTLNGVTLQNNAAKGSEAHNQAGQWAFGGGIYSDGTLTLEGNTKVQSNLALGGRGGYGQVGGSGVGGGVFVAAGTVTMISTVLSSNTAQGGQGGGSFDTPARGGDGIGGGIYAWHGTTIILHNDIVTANSALGGAGGVAPRGHASPGLGEGGGLYIYPLASVCLDAFTVANVINNTASYYYPNIYGSYTICP